MPNIIEQKAIKYSIRHLTKKGYGVKNVSKARGHNGYDLLAIKGGRRSKIEVKGCARPWGIPDFYFTEFNKNKRLVANYVYVVYFLRGQKPNLCIIPRKAFKPEFIIPKRGYRISGRFKNERNLKRHVVE